MSVNQIGGGARLTGLTVQADRIYGGVHHHAPTVPLPLPRQLPPSARHFTGREEDRLALDDARAAGARLFVVNNIGGVGKSALAVRWISESTYGDGQLYVDLSGLEGAVSSEAVLGRWLRAFGIDRPPADLAERTGLWRSVTATRSVAVLIDGATDAGQVRPLLPAGEDSVTVVTSRNALRDLVVDGAVLHPLGPLTQPAAVQLLARLAGPERITAAFVTSPAWPTGAFAFRCRCSWRAPAWPRARSTPSPQSLTPWPTTAFPTTPTLRTLPG